MADRAGSDELAAPFRPLRRRARWTVGLLAAGIVADAVGLWSGLREQSLLADLGAGRPVSFEEVDASDRRQAVVGVVQAGLFTLVAAAFLTWFYRAYRNLDALSERQRWGPGWSVGAWFVPILNLWRPKQLVNDVWRGSSGSDRVPVWIAIWWGVWLAAGFLYNGSFRLSVRAEELPELVTAGRVTMAADAASIAAALLAVALVLLITTAQEARAAAAGLVLEEPPTPLYRRGSTWASLAAILAAIGLQAVLFGAVWSGELDISEPTETEAGPIVEENFDTPGTGWLVDSGPDFVMGYQSGRYRIAVTRRGQDMHSYVELLDPVESLDLTVEATMREGGRRDGFGLGCWVGTGGYYGAVFTDGLFSLGKDPGTQVVERLAEGRKPGIGLEVTELRLECAREGDLAVRLVLWVDGRRMLTVRDRRPLGSFTGLGLFTSSASGRTDVRFDNLVARE